MLYVRNVTLGSLFHALPDQTQLPSSDLYTMYGPKMSQF
jgi:hypothetical protein